MTVIYFTSALGSKDKPARGFLDTGDKTHYEGPCSPSECVWIVPGTVSPADD